MANNNGLAEPNKYLLTIVINNKSDGDGRRGLFVMKTCHEATITGKPKTILKFNIR